MKKATEQAVKYVLKIDDTISPAMADTVMRLLGYIAIPNRKRKRQDEPSEEVLKALSDFLEFAKSNANSPECLNTKSLVKHCHDTYGNQIGDEVYQLFRGRLETFHFRIRKRDAYNLHFEYVGKK